MVAGFHVWMECTLCGKTQGLKIQGAISGNIATASFYFNGFLGVIKIKQPFKQAAPDIQCGWKGDSATSFITCCSCKRQLIVQEAMSQRSSTTAILRCDSAAGTTTPLVFVFAGANMLPEFLTGKYPGAYDTVWETEWSISVVLMKYLE